ncbi:hypothetical protein FGO68_gene453 [Halteria grandinella]|uniref:Uncharacterized protein n=1 Tax=Halteria grandinella TaxID=5974 RepID=A0A8J8NBG5_HALGN|nr:hypothetical protein FGO68_gene453 [Halteria grandinella]
MKLLQSQYHQFNPVLNTFQINPSPHLKSSIFPQNCQFFAQPCSNCSQYLGEQNDEQCFSLGNLVQEQFRIFTKQGFQCLEGA